jgi:hypothetical protein
MKLTRMLHPQNTNRRERRRKMRGEEKAAATPRDGGVELPWHLKGPGEEAHGRKVKKKLLGLGCSTAFDSPVQRRPLLRDVARLHRKNKNKR